MSAIKLRYEAFVWSQADASDRVDTFVIAEDLDDAADQLRVRFGAEMRMSVWNEDAHTPR